MTQGHASELTAEGNAPHLLSFSLEPLRVPDWTFRLVTGSGVGAYLAAGALEVKHSLYFSV